MTSYYSRDVWHLLRRNISKGQLAGFIIANIVGLSVVLIGVMFSFDCKHSSATDDNFFSADYIVLSKKVDGIGFTPNTFDESEIATLSAQPWVKKVGRFTSSQFAVNGTVGIGGRGLSSYLFFESVPDEFFDIKPRDWNFNPDDSFIPVILNKDYLALYNYGFAIPQGLPQISEEIIGAVPIQLRLTGEDGRHEYFEAAIVGFSSRLNTIAVPQSFMEWANNRYAPGVEIKPSRLIVEIDRMKSDSMKEYLDKEGIEVAGDNESSDNISSFLIIVSSVVTANGLIICALAMFILILSIFLMLQKSRLTLHNIMLLGYSPREIARYYNLVIILINLIVAFFSISITLIARTAWDKALHEIGLGGGPVIAAVIAVAVYFLTVTVIDLIIIRTHLRRIWHGAS